MIESRNERQFNEWPIGVSIICTAFNQEKYIRQCLDSFVMQKTDFVFEVLVNDDCSTDHTADIIREYEEKYPRLIHAVYQKKNLYSQHISIIGKVLLPCAKGKYIALCEGDDYWTDPYKLQREYDIMESHPDCGMCVCKVNRINEDGTYTGKSFPDINVEEGEIDSDETIRVVTEGYPFQTSGYFMKTGAFRVYHSDETEFRKYAPMGDVTMMLYFAKLGPIYYCDRAMSNYRENSISSIARRQKEEATAVAVKQSNNLLRMIEEYNKFSDYQYHELLARYYDRVTVRQFCLKGQYRELLKKENRSLLQTISRNQQMDIVLRALIPSIYPFVYEKIYQPVKEKWNIRRKKDNE